MCQNGAPPPLESPAKGNSVSLWTPYVNRAVALLNDPTNRAATRPIGNPEPKGLHPSGHLQFSSHCGTQTEKTQFTIGVKKIQKEVSAL